MSKVPGFRPEHVNTKIKKDSPKVVDTVDIEDLGDKVINIHKQHSVNLIAILIIDVIRACFAAAGRARSFRIATDRITSTMNRPETMSGRSLSRSPINYIYITNGIPMLINQQCQLIKIKVF